PGLAITVQDVVDHQISEVLAPYFVYHDNDITLLAGMAAILLPLLADLNNEAYRGQEITKHYQLHCNISLQPFRMKRQLPEAEISSTALRLSPDNMVQWMRNQSEFFYDAYVFTSLSFLQGIFTMCNYFAADYRNYIYGLPYDGKL